MPSCTASLRLSIARFLAATLIRIVANLPIAILVALVRRGVLRPILHDLLGKSQVEVTPPLLILQHLQIRRISDFPVIYFLFPLGIIVLLHSLILFIFEIIGVLGEFILIKLLISVR